MLYRDTDTEEAWFESLRTEVKEELSSFDGESFGSAVMSALDVEVEDAALALRADEATSEELADATLALEMPSSISIALRNEAAAEVAAVDFVDFGGEFMARLDGPVELSAAVQAALRVETEQEITALEPDFAGFGGEVMARVDPPFELSPAIVTLLRKESAEQIAFLESEWPDFVEEVMVRIDPVPENATVQAMLREEVGVELKRREGEWNAFTARVFDAIDNEERVTARLPLEEQAVHQLREEVDGELQDMAPHFEERFNNEVEKQIFKSGVGAQEPGLWDRFTGFIQDLTTPQNYGWAAALGAAAVLLVVTNIPTATNTIDPLPPIERLQGYVSVEDMSFEGSAIVIPDDGMTIVLLSDES